MNNYEYSTMDRHDFIDNYLTEIFAGADPENYFVIQWYSGTGYACDAKKEGLQLDRQRAFQVADLDDAIEFAQSKCDQDLYVTSTVFSEPNRQKKNAAQKRWIIAEYDDKDVSLQMASLPQPTKKIQSSPGKYHFYWDLGTWDLDVRDVGRINSEFVDANEFFDKGAKDLARVLRIPGTLHCKVEGDFHVVVELSDSGAVHEVHDFIVVNDTTDVNSNKSVLPASSDVSTDPRYVQYVENIIVEECKQIVEAPDGTQNNKINDAAFRIGTAVAWGTHDTEEVFERIFQAALEGNHPSTAAFSTTKSGFEAGLANPRDIPVLKESSGSKRSVNISQPHYAIEGILDAINTGALPDVYVNDGRLVVVTDVVGSLSGPRGQISKKMVPMTKPMLNRLCQKNLYMFNRKVDKKTGEVSEHQGILSPQELETILAETDWYGVKPLLGIKNHPRIRFDGTLLVEEGYDAATQFYVHLTDDYSDLNENPTEAEFLEAKSFLLDELLGDFPWKDSSDKANYFALLATPMLRDYINGDECNNPTPLGAITAHNASAGKTLLTDILGAVYGKTQKPWVDSDDEMRKTVMSTLSSTSNEIVLFDNVERSSIVSQPVLANLLTNSVWSDRTLGVSIDRECLNDRLWLVTGNNISFGGDLVSRTVLVRIDPNIPNPEERTGFKIPNLAGWVQKRANKRRILAALITVILYWIQQGASVPETPVMMRGYSEWTEKMQGLTDFLGIDGFLQNRDELRASDVEADEWTTFLAKWYEKFGTNEMKVKQVRDSFPNQDPFGSSDAYHSKDDDWDGAFFLVDKSGRAFSLRVLGDRFRQQVGNFHGNYVLRATHVSRNDSWTYHVEQV